MIYLSILLVIVSILLICFASMWKRERDLQAATNKDLWRQISRMCDRLDAVRDDIGEERYLRIISDAGRKRKWQQD